MTGFNVKYETYHNEYGAHQRPTTESMWMGLAVSLSERSTCLRNKVGAVITDTGMTKAYSVGYNGDHKGGKNQCDTLEPGMCGCIHAEVNAVIKSTDDIRGAIVFVTLSPCKMCAKMLINKEVGTVIYLNDYRNCDGIELLRKNGITVKKY